MSDATAAVYLCNPGEDRSLTPEQAAVPCRCRHERRGHWWGGGACGECRCEYFLAKPNKAVPPEDRREPSP